MKRCPKCKREIEDDGVFCEYCGYRLKKSKRPRLIVATALVLGVVLALVIRYVYVHESRDVEQQMFTNCQEVDDFREFLQRYPEGELASLARDKIDEFVKDSMAQVVEKSDAETQYEAGLRCFEGEDKNYEEAVKWFTLSAQQGHAAAQEHLGCCYYYGFGVAQSYEEAVKWMKLSAGQGDELAQCWLGNCYYSGKGVKQNYKEAVKWYEKAAKQGQVDAQYCLGSCYYNGEGVKKNDKESFKWFMQAAEQGYQKAQYYVGMFYESGQGVGIDEDAAAEWYHKAAKQVDSTKSPKITMGNAWLEHNVNGSLLIHCTFIAEDSEGRLLDVICTFQDNDKLFGKDLKDSNGEYCLFNGLVAAKCIPVLVEENQQKMSCMAEIPYHELHLEDRLKMFGKEWLHTLACQIKVVDVNNESEALGETKLPFLYADGRSEDKK